MYSIVYAIFYLISLLPLRVLYILSDAIYGILYYIIGYRRKVVHQNLIIAFPEKSDTERKKIEKAFYHQFVDTFIEAIKLISMSPKEFSKRFSINIDVLNNLYATGQNVQLVAGHFFSWEFANLGIAKQSKYPFIGVYMPLSNKVMDKIMYKMRSRFGTIFTNTQVTDIHSRLLRIKIRVG
jgi:KDO2-lipid IV(A) lauroyltransferase